MNAIVSPTFAGFDVSIVRRLLERARIRAVPRHAVVQARAARHEAFGLRVVRAVHEAHELARDVAMEPGRAERILGGEPARREDHEVDRIDARRVARRLQHEKDRRIGMVEADRADRVEVAQVVLVRRVVAVPRDHVERRMADVRAPQHAVHLRDEFELAFAILVGGVRREEVARIREAVRADRAEVRQSQQRAEVLADVAARRAVGQRHGETHAARNHRDLERLDVEPAHFGRRSTGALPAARSAVRRRRCRRSGPSSSGSPRTDESRSPSSIRPRRCRPSSPSRR